MILKKGEKGKGKREKGKGKREKGKGKREKGWIPETVNRKP
jgi:hypothetical protein